MSGRFIRRQFYIASAARDSAQFAWENLTGTRHGYEFAGIHGLIPAGRFAVKAWPLLQYLLRIDLNEVDTLTP